ncbi:MAG: 3,4-dihydroxy-2-butanone-4-phosphate synthase, partial [Acidimicrobiia bacterium]
MTFAPIEDVIAAIGRGEMVIMVDDEDRENEGDLIVAADEVTVDQVGFMLRHTSGIIC